jgi:SAM-dependent methyltransferase
VNTAKSKSTPKEFQHRQQILEMLRAYRQSQIMIACTNLKIFESLAEGPMTSRETAGLVGATERGTDLLMNAAAAAGLLEKHGEHFNNSPAAQTCLGHRGDHFLGDFIAREVAFYNRWGNLLEAVRTGQRPAENKMDEQSGNWVMNFEKALFDLSRGVAPHVADALDLPEDKHLQVIDVGGGHGGYSIALARRYPNLTATVFELPAVVPVARDIIASEGLSNRVTLQEGDFQKDELGSGYDLALLFGVMGGETPEGKRDLIRKAFRALNPGGRLILREFLLEPDRTQPPEAALFAVQMLLSTDKGGVSTREEMEGWIKDAGFLPPEKVDLPDWLGTTLWSAEKPG